MVVREVAQLGSAPALGAGGRRFKSCLPDHSKPFEVAVSGTRVVVQFGSIPALGAGGRRFKSCLPDARVAQLVEQLICNQPAVGSSPISGSMIKV